METSGTESAHLESILEVCANLGVEQLRTYMRHAGSVAETVDRTMADLRVAGPVFERAGVRLMLENHEDFTGAEMAAILAAVDHPWVGALYDYGNSMMVGKEPMTAMPIPAKYRVVPESTPAGQAYNVAQAYVRAADALRGSGSFDVDFNLAVQRHKLIDAIERSSASGRSVKVE